MNAEKEGTAIAKKYGVSGFPTILFLNSDGKVEGTIVGYKPAEPFGQDVTRFVSTHRDLPAIESRYKSNPNDAEAAERLAAIYAGRGDMDKAEAALSAAAKADPANAKGYLAAAYNAVGDHYQEAKAFTKAIPMFQQGAKVAKKPYEAAYAQMSIASCYFEQQKPKDAIPALNAVIAMKNAPSDLLEQAKQMLQTAKRGGQ